MPNNRHKPKPANLIQRIEKWFNGLSRTLGKRFGLAMEYFEWGFHQFAASVGTVFHSISMVLLPWNWIDRKRRQMAKKSLESKADREQNESGTSRFIDTLEYWFTMAAKSISGVFTLLFQIFFPSRLVKSTEKAVSKTTQAAWTKGSSAFSKFLKRYTPKWMSRLGTYFARPFKNLFGFFNAWISTRNYRQLLWSLPALLLLLPMLASLAYSLVYTETDLLRHYENSLLKAIEEDNIARQELCMQKLTQLGYRRLGDAEFNAALALADDPATWDDAVERMRELAPLDKPGLTRAHLWIADNLALGRIRQRQPWEAMEQHAQRVLDRATRREEPFKQRAKVLLTEADLHFAELHDRDPEQRGQPNVRRQQAIERMEELVSAIPEISLELMEQHILEGDQQAARKYARRVDDLLSNKLKNMRKLTESSPTINTAIDTTRNESSAGQIAEADNADREDSGQGNSGQGNSGQGDSGHDDSGQVAAGESDASESGENSDEVDSSQLVTDDPAFTSITRQSASSSSFEPDECRTWIRALSILEQHQKQIDVLDLAHQWFPDEAQFLSGLEQTVVRRLSTLPLDSEDILPLLRRLVQIRKDHEAVTALLARGILQGDPNIPPLMTELRRDNLLSERVFMLVGDTYVTGGNFNAALNSYRQAVQLNQKEHRAMNNIAGLLDKQNTPESLAKAIKVSNLALALHQEPRYYETRGQVYVKLKRWDEAIEDLERALNGRLPNPAPTHASLAKAYAAIGQPELANVHRQKSQTAAGADRSTNQNRRTD